MRRDSIHDIARGKWRGILMALQFPDVDRILRGKHMPCPSCGGEDRFRFDDKEGRGTFFCSQCGAGNGVELVMRVRKVGFADAARMVEEAAGHAPVEVKRAAEKTGRTSEWARQAWQQATPLNGIDPASKYLARRSIRIAPFPKMLRFVGRARYVHDDKRSSYHPAMLARFVSPDGERMTVQWQFLDDKGNKADLGGAEKSRKLAPCPVPQGGAVRLASSAETMGVAEGIETALSAMQRDGIPVWATLSSGLLAKWEPPPSVKHLIVYGDHDSSFTGQAAAYALAHRLKCQKQYARIETIEVRMPGVLVEHDAADTDWNDVLRMERGGCYAVGI